MTPPTEGAARSESGCRRLVCGCAVVTCAVMGLFVVGGHFNDGGWYLYAAKLACTGHVPYRDFLFPQPPLALYLYGPLQALSGGSLLLGRLTAVVGSLTAMALSVGLAKRLGGWAGAAFVATCFAVNWYTLYHLTIVKTYPLAALFLLGGAWACAARRFGTAQAFFFLATLTRLSALPAVFAAAILEGMDRRTRTAAAARALATLTALACVGAWLSALSGGRLLEQLYLPMGAFIPGLTQYYVGGHEDYGVSVLLFKKFASVVRTGLLYWLPLVGLCWGARRVTHARRPRFPREATTLLAVAVPVALGHLLTRRPYEEYQTIVFPLLCVAAGQVVGLLWGQRDGSDSKDYRDARVERKGGGGGLWRLRPSWRFVVLLLPLFVAPVRGAHRLDWTGGRSALGELRQAAAVVRQYAPSDQWLLTLEPYLAVESKRNLLPPELLMGRYAYHPGWSDARRRQLPVVNEHRLYELLADRPRVVAIAPNHFLTADPGRLTELRRQYERFLTHTREHYRVVAQFEEFGYARDTLTLFARRDG